VVRNLRATDQFSLVVFDNEAQTLIPCQSATDRLVWRAVIEKIQPGGSTNLTGGWMLGREELKKAAAGATRRLLLLSDGQLNAGVMEPGQVQRIVANGLEQDQIRTSCLGFGPAYQEDLLAECARLTGGQFYDAQAAESLPTIFAAELEGLQKLVVQNLRVRVKRLDFCDSTELLGQDLTVTLPDGRHEIAVGDLTAGETRILCFELGVLPLPLVAGQPVCSLEGEQLLELEFHYDEIRGTEATSRTVTQTIRIQATQNPEEVKVREEVVSWVALQKAGRTMDEVTQQMDAGQRNAAAELLERTIEQLQAYGTKTQVAEALQQLEQLRGVVVGGFFSLQERKSSKYRSASIRKMSSSEHWSLPEAPPSFKQPLPSDDSTSPQS